jgi:uncharacterized protein (TIGR02145 family)
VINAKTTPVNNDPTYVTFGVYPTSAFPSGVYQNSVLYTAVSVDPPLPTTHARVANGANFQDTTLDQSENCQALTVFNGNNTGAIITMTDTRNDQQYRVARLADNKCWMMDNLKIAGVEINNITSDLPSDAVAFFLPAAVTSIPPDTSVSLYTGDPNAKNYCLKNYLGIDVFDQVPDTKTGCGYLYNFYTATATTASQDSTSRNSSGSICPKNWKLPTGYNNIAALNDYALLNGYMAGGSMANQNYSFGTYYHNWRAIWQGVLSGSAGRSANESDGAFFEQGSSGYFWSSTSISDLYGAFALNIYEGSEYLDPAYSGYHYRTSGFAMRCVLAF